MNRKTTKTTLKSLGAAGLLIAAGIATMPADAGFKHNGWAGNGFVTSHIPQIGPLTLQMEAYLAAVSAANPGLTDAQARDKASAIHEGLCKAVDLATKQNATVGACLSKLKKKGSLCVSFNMKGAVGGAVNDGDAACTENDKINISSKKLVEGCPPPYDPALYWVATILLHEGTHATQDYTADVTGLDACKARAKKTKLRLCNEAGTGVGADPKGAHVVENEWIAEIKEALDELESIDPQSQLDWSEATSDMFNGIFPLPEPDRQNAIDALRKAACANKRGNDDAIDCYRKAKQKLQDFIDTNYANPTEKAAAQKILRDCLNTAKWKWIFKFFDIPAKALLSNSDSPIIQQFEDDSTADDLDTGLLGVSDMELLEDVLPGELSPFLDVLLVVGPTGPDQGQMQIYIDDNDNGVFEQTELADALPMPPGVSGHMDIILPQQGIPSGEPYVFYNHDTFEFFAAQPSPIDGLPLSIDPFPFFQIQQPQLIDLAHLIQEWDWQDNLLVGYDDMITGAQARTFDDEVLVLEDQNLDGLPDFEVPFANVLPLVQFGPTWGGELLPGDNQIEMFGYPGHQIEIQILDPLFVPIEIVALQLASVAPINVTLSRPLAPGDLVMLQDLDNGIPSPVEPILCIGDINGDGVVDTADLGILLADFGFFGVSPADLNNDGAVDTADLGLLLNNFGCPN